MLNRKTVELLKTVSGLLLCIAVFLALSLSDVVRLYPGLEGIGNGAVKSTAQNSTVSISMSALVPGDALTEGMETDYSDQPTADVGLIDNGVALTINDTEYTLFTLEDFVALGGKLTTGRDGGVRTVEYEGVTYGTGTVRYEERMWDNMNGFQRLLLHVAGVLNYLMVLFLAALLCFVAMSVAQTARAQEKSVSGYLADKFTPRKIWKFITNNIIIVLIVLFSIAVAIHNPNFANESNIRNLLSNTAVRFIIALGVSGCLITRGTDLSAGRVAGFAACISAILLQRGDYSSRFYPDMPELPIIVVLLIVLAICAIIGIVNGSVVAIFKVPPFIATLGMQTLVYGICLVYTGASPIGGLRSDYTDLATGYIGNRMFSYILIIAVVVGALMWFLYNKTRHGKYMYAIGGNEAAAEVAGINTVKSKILIYMLAALLYGLMGFLSAAKTGGASVNTAQGYELEAIAGCTIGGVSVNGGVGKISGILVGVLVFEVLKIALQFLGVESSYTYIVQGLVIIIAVALDLRKYLAKK